MSQETVVRIHVGEPSLTFTGIPSDRCDEYWPIIEPVLSRAIARTDGRHSAFTTRRAILDDKMQLWAAFEDDGMSKCVAALVTQTVIYPTGVEELEIVLCAGKVFPDCLELLGYIEAWGKSVGCSKVRLIGRKGWSRALAGYSEIAVVMERDLAA